MRKLIAIALLFLVGTTLASAKVVRSRTVSKKSSTVEWVVRVGASINNAAGASSFETPQFNSDNGSVYLRDVSSSVGPRLGLDLTGAFQKSIGRTNAYWGMEFGLGSRNITGVKSRWNVKFLPVNFGYKYPINSNIKLDGHLGAFVSCDFAGLQNYDSANELVDAGMQLGVGIWLKKFNIDLAYQRGFVSVDVSSGSNNFSSNVLLRVGYSF
jgi:hypothetical protein